MNEEHTRALRAEIDDMMSDDQLIDRAAYYNAIVRRGRRLAAEGNAIVSANINLFVMCQNELFSRLGKRIERESDREDR